MNSWSHFLWLLVCLDLTPFFQSFTIGSSTPITRTLFWKHRLVNCKMSAKLQNYFIFIDNVYIFIKFWLWNSQTKRSYQKALYKADVLHQFDPWLWKWWNHGILLIIKRILGLQHQTHLPEECFVSLGNSSLQVSTVLVFVVTAVPLWSIHIQEVINKYQNISEMKEARLQCFG